MSFEKTVGSRAQVWHGTAKHTSGGLHKSQLMMNKSGRIVSRKKHASAKRENRLVKAGYKTKKGHFGFVKVGSKTRGRKGHRKGHRGGSGGLFNRSPLTPLELGQSGGAIYGSDAIGADLSSAYDTSDMKGPSGDGIAGAGITDFGSGSISAQMRAGMAGGRRRRRRSRMMGGTGTSGTMESPPLAAALGASGGSRRRRHRGGSYNLVPEIAGGRRRRNRHNMMGGIADTLQPAPLY